MNKTKQKEDDMKECTKCHQVKSYEDFGKRKAMRDGRKSRCKSCECIEAKSRYWENPELYRAKSLEYQGLNKKKVMAYRKSNLEKINKNARLRRDANPEKYRAIAGKWRDANPEKCREYSKNWRDNNPEKFKELHVAQRKANPKKFKARQAVNYAIIKGRIARPESCSSCFKNCKPDAHHWSYEKEHWLDVVWLCRRCHAEEHKRLRILSNKLLQGDKPKVKVSA